jgi:hypothetical protein
MGVSVELDAPPIYLQESSLVSHSTGASLDNRKVSGLTAIDFRYLGRQAELFYLQLLRVWPFYEDLRGKLSEEFTAQ